MMRSTIRVLVVDDAEFLRKNLPVILESDPLIKVVGTASTGHEGIEMARRLNPDVITMDVVMPEMDGLEALKIIMREVPTPVVMLSSKTRQGAAETVEALSLGAVDFIAKPSGQVSLDIGKIRREIIKKVRLAGSARVSRLPAVYSTGQRFASLSRGLKSSLGREGENGCVGQKDVKSAKSTKVKVIGMVASTGGPVALEAILTALPADYSIPIGVVQHIGPEYIPHLIERFDRVSRVRVKAAANGEVLEPGTVYFSPRRDHLTFKKKGQRLNVRLSEEPKQLLYRPSGNELLWSIGANLGRDEACGVVLTGMGDDGAQGLKRIKEAGGRAIVQEEKSCVVFGMPKQAIAVGAAEETLSLEGIIDRLLQLAGCAGSTAR